MSYGTTASSKLPKLGLARIVRRGEIPDGGKLKSASVSGNAAGRRHAALPREFDAAATAAVETDADKALGLDFSTPDPRVDSDGNKPGKTRRFRDAEKRLARARESRASAGKGASAGTSVRKRVARRHLKARNQREDFLEKESRRIANAFDAAIA